MEAERGLFSPMPAVWLVLLVLAPGLPARAGIGTDWLAAQRTQDGAYTLATDTATAYQATAETLGLAQVAGATAPFDRAGALAYLEAEAYAGTEYLARRIVARAQVGDDTAHLLSQLASHQGTDGGFAELPGFETTALDSAFALDALAVAGRHATPEAGLALGYLTDRQHPDGGWTRSRDGVSSVYVTALALQALARYRTRYDLAAPIASARGFLLNRRDASHTWGETPLTAASLLALTAVAHDPTAIALSLSGLRSAQSANGSWNGDVYATALALRALRQAETAIPNPDLAQLAGRVIDGDSGLALAGVTARLSGAHTEAAVTGPDGELRFVDLPAGVYELTLSLAGYGGLSTTTTLAAGQRLDFGTLALIPSAGATTGTLYGTVTDAATAAPLAGVRIATNRGQSTHTAADGTFQISHLAPGVITLSAELPGYRRALGSASLSAGGVLVFSPALVPLPSAAAALFGRVVDARSGVALTGVTLDLSGPRNDTLSSAQDGGFRFQPLPAGAYELTLTLTGYHTLIVTATLGSGRELDLGTLALSAAAVPTTGSVRGTVTDAETGQPLPGVLVSTSRGHRVATGPEGAFRIDQVAPGGITLSAVLDGYHSAVGEANLSAGGLLVFSPALVAWQTEGAAVYGRILAAATAQPLSGARVEVSGSTDATALTASDGRYRIAPLEPGPLSIQVSLEGYDTVTAGTLVHEHQQIAFSPVLYPRAATPPGENTASLAGTVVDATTGAPLAGVSIEASQDGQTRVLVSGADGRFRMAGIRSAELMLNFSLDGYRPVALSLPVDPLAAKDVGQVRLRPLGVETLLPDLVVTALDAAGSATDAHTLALSGTLGVVVKNRGTRPAESGFAVLAFYDADADGQLDTGTDPVVGTAAVAGGLATGAEAALSIGLSGTLPFRDAPVSVWADSGMSLVEQDESNNTADSAMACRLIETGRFDPVLKWHWTHPPDRSAPQAVYGPPMVGQLSDDNGDGRIDRLDSPDLVFADASGALNVVSGADGRSFRTLRDLPLSYFGSLALGDIDGDGVVEILATDRNNRRELFALEHDGRLKWRVPSGPPHNGHANHPRDGIAIADLDADGAPEIVHGDRVYAADGTLRWIGGRDRGGEANYGLLPIVADIDLDGNQEVIAGRSVYDHAGHLLWHRGELPGDGFNAVGNFDADDTAEIVLVARGTITLLEHDGTPIWGPVAIPGGGGRGGAPTVADFDNDGEPEIGVAAYSRYVAFDTDGSVLWQAPVQDYSSARTGSSLFDFEADGRVEVLYADEHYLRVYDGATGAVRMRIANGSGTTYEYPLVADIDNDGSAEILVPSSRTQYGVRVYASASGSWANTRALWNQHSYHITNIADDGRIPAHEPPAWLGHNSYRLNALVDRDPLAVPDLSLARLRLIDNGTDAPFELAVRAGSGGGTGPAGAVTLAFYQGDPGAGGLPLGTLSLEGLSAPDWRDLRLEGITLSAAADLYALIDPQDRIRECNETNNRLSIPVSSTAARGAIQVSTDAATFGPNRPVALQAVVRNTGSFAADYRVALRIEDAAGAIVTELAARTLSALAAGAEDAVGEPWSTGATLAGEYVLRGRLYDREQRLLAEAASPFTIQAGSGPRLSLRTTTDRPRYHTTDTLEIANRVRNLSVNTLIDDAGLRLELTDPAGQPIHVQTLPLGQLPAGATRERITPYGLTDAAPGPYRVRVEVRDGAGAVLATDSATFDVAQDPRKVVSGEVSARFDRLYPGTQQICTDRLANSGTLAIEGLRIQRRLTRLDQSAAITVIADRIALPAGATHTLVRAIDTAALAAGDYACVLQARFDPHWATLDFDDFRLDTPPIDAELGVGAHGRVLILLDPPAHGGGCGHKRDDAGDPDGCRSHQGARGKVAEPTPADQRAYLEDLLIRHGWSYTLVTRKAAFAEQQHRGGYSSYGLLAGQEKLAERVQDELREAVFRGEGLLVAGGHNRRHHGLQGTLGIAYRGKHPKASGLDLAAGRFTTPGQSPFGFADKGLKIRPAGAEVVGRFTGTGEDPEPAAVTRHDYGWGRAVHAGFDLLAQATQAGGENPFSDLILDALDHVQPQQHRLADGAVIPLSLRVANRNGPTPLVAQLFPPAQATLVDPGSGDLQPDGSLLWRLDLAEDETVARELWVRLPRGRHTVTAETGVGQAPPFGYTETDRLVLDIPAPPPLSVVLEMAAAMEAAERKGPYKKVRQRLERAESWLEKGKPGQALHKLLKATEPLHKETGTQAAELRRAIGQQIWHTARAWVGG